MKPVKKGSRPVWGAWIEMVRRYVKNTQNQVAPRMGRVDLNQETEVMCLDISRSRPVWGAWIEIDAG